MRELAPYILSDSVRLAFATPPESEHYFGYYCCSPLSANGQHLLAHRSNFGARELTMADRVSVGVFEVRTGGWREIAVTRSFNWQQGAMLQWLGPDFASRVIFNDQEGDRFVARVADVNSGQVATAGPAIYAVHPSGDLALGVRFERHYYTRAYHYEGVADARWNVPIHPDDGILAIDLRSGRSNLLIRTADIAAMDPPPGMDGLSHWLEHILWNPAGSRFAFLHRFGTAQRYTTRVFTANADGGDIWCMPGWQEWQYSHMAWRDNDSFVMFSAKTKPLAGKYAAMTESRNPVNAAIVWAYRFLKRFVPRDFTARRALSSGYALVRDRTGVVELLSTGLLREDGHPSWTQDGRFMLTDTYALEDGNRRLLLFDAAEDRIDELGRFYSPYNNCGHRCDLHPRFSLDERYAIIDTAHTGRRQIMVLELDWTQLR